jgi:hypothetical protein
MEKEDFCIMHDENDDVDIIEVPAVDDMGGLEVVTLVEGEKGEKGEKCEKEIDNSKPMTEKKLEIELLINTSTCDEVIFKKHVIEIIDKVTRKCVMYGVVVRYEFEGRAWDPDVVLVFEDGRRFCNDNFGYMFRYYI